MDEKDRPVTRWEFNELKKEKDDIQKELDDIRVFFTAFKIHWIILSFIAACIAWFVANWINLKDMFMHTLGGR